MTHSRRQLYALLEPFGESCTCAKPGGRVYGGGGSKSSTAQNTTDMRVAAQDGIGISGSGNTAVYNSSDAVVAIAAAGADVIKASGGAVVDIYKNAGQQNADTWNTTITAGVTLVDKLIDKVGAGFGLAEKTIDSFTPTENKNAEAIKYAAIAAGVVGVAALWKK